MSKLRDRIRRMSRQESTPMGFARAAAPRTMPGLLLLAIVDSAGAAEEASSAGADALLFAQAPRGGVKGMEATPWGFRVADNAAAADLSGTQADFVVVGQDLGLEAIGDTDLGVVLEADESWPDAIVQSIQVFSPDAIYVRSGGGLTMRRLLEIRRLSGLAGPLLLEVDSPPPSGALQLLRDAGVAGLVLTSGARKSIAGLRQQVDAMPPRKRKREEGSMAVIPRVESLPMEDDEDLP